MNVWICYTHTYMEHPSFEVTGGSRESIQKKEVLGGFNWQEFEPPWIEKIRETAKTDSDAAEQLKAKEAQMNTIAELAKDAGVEFRGMISDGSNTNLLAEEGLVHPDSVEFHKKQEQIWNSPLMLMISWGSKNGIITSDEAQGLQEWYKPEL